MDHKDGYGLHSIAYDKKGNLWFTPTASNVTDNNLSIGYLTSDWQDIVMLSPLKYFEAKDSTHSAGIAIDPVTGDIWFAEFERERIGRLKLL